MFSQCWRCPPALPVPAAIDEFVDLVACTGRGVVHRSFFHLRLLLPWYHCAPVESSALASKMTGRQPARIAKDALGNRMIATDAVSWSSRS